MITVRDEVGKRMMSGRREVMGLALNFGCLPSSTLGSVHLQVSAVISLSSQCPEPLLLVQQNGSSVGMLTDGFWPLPTSMSLELPSVSAGPGHDAS